jgi:phospholipase C
MSSHLSRRTFLERMAAAGAVAGLTGGPFAELLEAKQPLPTPASSGIEHVIVLMMENRSFDHFLGWLPGANGRQAGLTYYDKNNQPHPTYHLTTFQGCAFGDPDHSYPGGRIQYDNGRCDGWLKAATNDQFPIGYYQQRDLSFLGQAAPEWTVCSNYFAGILGPTYPNRVYQHAAQTDRLGNSTTISTLPTIWDRLAAAGLQGRYYFNDAAFTALWGTRYVNISLPYTEFLAACASGTLPQVAFVDPRFEDEGSGTSGDDHPHADIRNGEAFLNQVYEAVTKSPNWANTVLVINYDEWGGFFDHVPPPLRPIPPADQALGSDGRIGFRVPGLVISPFARRSHVATTQFDHTSVLNMIEWRWSLDPLTVRDATANNLATVLDFARPQLRAPQYAVPAGPFGGACTSLPVSTSVPADSEETEWAAIRALAIQYGFPVS